MKEALFILLVILVLAGFTVFRYRRHIRTAMEFWRTVKSIKERAGSIGGGREIEHEVPSKGPLTRCQKCGTWVPEDRAIRLGRSATYCSTKCLEKSTAVR